MDRVDFDKTELKLIFKAVQEYKNNHIGMYSQLDPTLECDGVLYRIESFLRKEKEMNMK